MTDDPEAIRRLLHDCADAVCHGDARPWAGLWVTDCMWQLDPDRRFHGITDVAAAWTRSMARYRAVEHLYLSSSAAIDGDHATGRADLVELLEPSTGEPRMITGRYDDVYVRTDDGWRFQQRVFDLRYVGPLGPGSSFLRPFGG